MPLPLTKEAAPVAPNTYYYDLSIANRIDDTGRLVVAATAVFHRCRCDGGVWQEAYTTPVAHQIADLDAYAAADEQIAPLVANAIASLHALVDAINDKHTLV